MKAGNFSIREYINKLYENAETAIENKEGIIIPDENRKSYDWLKKEYKSSQTAVKVEISGQGSSFKPGYDIQAAKEGSTDFTPGILSDTSSSKGPKNEQPKETLDSNKDKSGFQPGEGEKEKPQVSKTSDTKSDINNKEKDTEEPKEKEKKEDKGEKTDVKKIDLKTKK